MALATSNLIRLPYTPDLTQAGIAYACRSLPYTYDRMGGSDFNRLRRIVSGKAVELAFRRYLQAQEVPYDNRGETPFTEPDRYDISLGGRRCDIKSFQIFHKERIRRLHRDPQSLLYASALVPRDQFTSDQRSDEEIYIFAFLTALTAEEPEETQRALTAGQPVYFVYPLPEHWARPLPWSSLGRLAVKAESSQPVTIELGGEESKSEFRSETLDLPPSRRILAKQEFFSLSYLHVAKVPTGRIGINSSRLNETLIIEPKDWGNIWIYGIEIFLAGYMTRGEFRRRARLLPAGSRVLQYNRTRTPNYAVALEYLHPVDDLLRRARAWAGKTTAS